MKIYSIFDDFNVESIKEIEDFGYEITLNEEGKPRPTKEEMTSILRDYECVIIGTSQNISEEMFENINSPKIIATASVGIDHIQIPENKQHLITVINTPNANAQSVAEYTMGCLLCSIKRIKEGNILFENGQEKKFLSNKPQELSGKKIGVIGAGKIAQKIIEYAFFFGLEVYCWTKHPEKHEDLKEKGVMFTSIEGIAKRCDIISVNLPNVKDTKNLISKEIIEMMRNDAIFISISRIETMDWKALMDKAINSPSFYVNLDVDVCDAIVEVSRNINNIVVTPHIAGGTMESRKKMFAELTEALLKM